MSIQTQGSAQYQAEVVLDEEVIATSAEVMVRHQPIKRRATGTPVVTRSRADLTQALRWNGPLSIPPLLHGKRGRIVRHALRQLSFSRAASKRRARAQ